MAARMGLLQTGSGGEKGSTGYKLSQTLMALSQGGVLSVTRAVMELNVRPEPVLWLPPSTCR